MVKAGVIGLGIGKHHLRGYSNNPEVKIWAIADIDEERLKRSSQEYSVPHYFKDYRKLLNLKDLDLVSVALPNFLHSAAAIEALESGKHVLVEKPMALNSREAEKMVKAAKENKKILMVGMNYHYFSEFQFLKQLAERGEFGDIYYIKAVALRKGTFPRGLKTWFKDRQKSGGGSLIDMGPHMIDLSLWMVNDFNVISVDGVAYSKFMPVDDFASALIRLSKGATVNIEISWKTFAKFQLSLSLLGTKGGATTNPLKLYKEMGDTPVEVTPEVKAEDFSSSIEKEIAHFIECIMGEKQPASSAQKGLKVMKIVDAIYESAKVGKEIRMDCRM